MTRDEWLNYGLAHGYCSELFCHTHENVPALSDEEAAEIDAGGDPCIVGVRVYDEWEIDE